MVGRLAPGTKLFSGATSVINNFVGSRALTTDRVPGLAASSRMAESPAGEALHRRRIVRPGPTSYVTEIDETRHRRPSARDDDGRCIFSDIPVLPRYPSNLFNSLFF